MHQNSDKTPAKKESSRDKKVLEFPSPARSRKKSKASNRKKSVNITGWDGMIWIIHIAHNILNPRKLMLSSFLLILQQDYLLLKLEI